MDSIELFEQTDTKKNNSYKQYIILFVLFIFITSDIFVNSVLTNIGNTVKCRSPTNWGVIIQGIFLVFFYILFIYLIQNGLI